jgi:hypothetical protein
MLSGQVHQSDMKQANADEAMKRKITLKPAFYYIPSPQYIQIQN